MSLSEQLQAELEPLPESCPDGLTPDGEVCPRCGKTRAPSGVDGGSWVHAGVSKARVTRWSHGVKISDEPLVTGKIHVG